MKYSEFKRLLTRKGAVFKEHGGRHDKWINPENGHSAYLPRHGAQEINEGLRKEILRKLFGTD